MTQTYHLLEAYKYGQNAEYLKMFDALENYKISLQNLGISEQESRKQYASHKSIMLSGLKKSPNLTIGISDLEIKAKETALDGTETELKKITDIYKEICGLAEEKYKERRITRADAYFEMQKAKKYTDLIPKHPLAQNPTKQTTLRRTIIAFKKIFPDTLFKIG